MVIKLIDQRFRIWEFLAVEKIFDNLEFINHLEELDNFKATSEKNFGFMVATD